jgi:hypothetical protein
MIELELLDMVLHIVKEKSTVLLAKNKEYNKYLDKILNKEIDPYTVAMKFGRSLVARGR